MDANIDLRYGLCFMFLLLLDYDPLATYHPTVKKTFLLVIAIVTFLFLFISIKLPLSVTVAANAIRLRAGDFSVPLAVALLCSIVLPWTHFWIAYFIIIGTCISPWYASLSNLLNRFLNWFYHTLQAIPTVNIIWFTQQQEHPEHEPPLPLAEVELVEIEGNPLQPSLEQDSVVVIDE